MPGGPIEQSKIRPGVRSSAQYGGPRDAFNRFALSEAVVGQILVRTDRQDRAKALGMGGGSRLLGGMTPVGVLPQLGSPKQAVRPIWRRTC
jgi:hypothetical protein